MKVPFTSEEFLDVFRQYNLAVWPMQAGLYLLALAAIFLAIKQTAWSHKAIGAILSFFWLWMGIAYHIIYFAPVNKAAYAFGALFIIQGMLFAYYGLLKEKIQFKYSRSIYGLTGIALIAYALLVYPLLGYWQQHMYPSTPTFGLPCPTTIFTFGLLLWTNKRFPFVLLVIPFLWSVIGISAAMKFGIKEDLGLVVSGVLCMLLILLRNRKDAKALHLNKVHPSK